MAGEQPSCHSYFKYLVTEDNTYSVLTFGAPKPNYMKKQFTLLTCLSLFSAGLHAQITINQSDYTSWTAGKDTLKAVGAATGMPGANATWDLTGRTYGSTSTRVYTAGTLAALPAATYYTSETVPVATGINLSLKRYHGNTAQGIQTLGMSLPRNAFSLAAATMGPTDSLVFEAQDIAATSPLTNLAFPATMGTNWSSNFSITTNFKLSVAFLSFSNVPGSIKKIYAVQDSVKGWGKMKLKDLNGQATNYMEVLAVKVHTQVTDSFFLSGAPMDPSLLAAVGVDQGAVTHEYAIRYYREGEVTPLLEVQYTDATYSTEDGAEAHMNRMAPTGVSNVTGKDNGIAIYPNPVTDRNINVRINNAAAHTWSYELIDMSGRRIAGGNLDNNGDKAQVKVGAENAAGIYQLNILKNGNPAAKQSLIIR